MIPDYSNKTDAADPFRDGHRCLTKAIPGAIFYKEPKWLAKRCRAYAAANRTVWTDYRGKQHFHQPAVCRSLGDEFQHWRATHPLARLFDHWGQLTLPDGRVALFSCPYLAADSYQDAVNFGDVLGLETLSLYGDLSFYGYTTAWYLWAEPITKNQP